MGNPLFWRAMVMAIEFSLTFSLIAWMRSAGRGKPPPWTYIFKILGTGALVALVSAFFTLRYSFDLDELQVTRPDFVLKYGPWLTLINILSASMIEELAKYAIGVFLILGSTHIRRLSDTIVYLIIIGLGFALIEDALYMLNPETVPVYRLLSFYLHAGTSAMIGYSLGRFRFHLCGYRELIISVLGAISLHGIFNLSTQLENQEIALYLTMLVILFISTQIFILFRKTLEEELEMQYSHRVAPEPTKLLNL